MFEEKEQKKEHSGSFLKRKDFDKALEELQEISDRARQVYEEENGERRIQKED